MIGDDPHMRLFFSIPSFLITAALLTGCGDSGPTGSQIVIREVPESQQSFRLVDSSAERFRYQKRDEVASSEPSRAAAPPQLIYTTPGGWEEKAASMMRAVNLSFGENSEGECYVARLPGAGGGLVANVNRWRGQMGADPLTEEEISALPKKPLFGQPATYMAVDGDFSPGMGSSDVKKNHRLLGLILASDTGAVFVKMTGPNKLVTENEAAFDVFTSSLGISSN